MTRWAICDHGSLLHCPEFRFSPVDLTQLEQQNRACNRAPEQCVPVSDLPRNPSQLGRISQTIANEFWAAQNAIAEVKNAQHYSPVARDPLGNLHCPRGQLFAAFPLVSNIGQFCCEAS